MGDHLKERGGRISFDEAMDILLALMDALDEIHASGTIHRDLSPDNIYLYNDSGQFRFWTSVHPSRFCP